jgi:hypothetical protein
LKIDAKNREEYSLSQRERGGEREKTNEVQDFAANKSIFKYGVLNISIVSPSSALRPPSHRGRRNQVGRD